jgi:hypothetical protein
MRARRVQQCAFLLGGRSRGVAVTSGSVGFNLQLTEYEQLATVKEIAIYYARFSQELDVQLA